MSSRNKRGATPTRPQTVGGHAHGDEREAAAPPAHASWAWRWCKRFIGASAVASVVVLTQGLWDPLEESAVTFAAPLSAALNAWRGTSPRGVEQLAIVKLDERRYIDRYDGREPLDRCALVEDLGRLAAVPRVHTVAVDFDLSPVRSPTKEQDECQTKLDQLLTDRANVTRWLLMRPALPLQHPTNLAAILQWRKTLCMAGVAFVDVSVDTKRGWVRNHVPVYGRTPAMGLAVDQRLRGPSRAPEDEPLPVAPSTEAECDRDIEHAREQARHPTQSHAHTSSRPISFLALTGVFRHGDDPALELKLDDACLQTAQRPAACAQITTLIFGSGYTELDRFATPVGKLDGVDLHAAVAACPAAGVNHMVLFGLEILFGAVILAPLFEWGWSRYFLTASGVAHRQALERRALWRARRSARRWFAWLVPSRPQAAYVWIFLIALLAAGLFVALFVFGVVWSAMRECPVIEAPIAIVLGMFIEVAVTQNIEVSSELVSEMQESHDHPVPAHAPQATGLRALLDPHALIKLALYAALLTAAVTYLRHDWTWAGASQHLLHR